MKRSLRFRVDRWLSEQEFRELLEFSTYIGRGEQNRVSLFELDEERMRRLGYTLRDVYVKLTSVEGVREEDLEEIRRAYEEEMKVEISLAQDGSLLVSAKRPLKEVLLELTEDLRYDPSIRAFKLKPYLYSRLVNHLSSKGLLVDDKVGLLSRKLPRAISFSGTLRDYQEEALNAWSNNGNMGVIALPTGAGKTVVGIAAAARLGVPTLVVAYTKEHVKQWVEAFKRFTDAGVLVGAYYGEEKKLSPITVSTYQSASMLMRDIAPTFSLVIFDEAHHLPARKFKELALWMPAPYKMALSATPEREDGMHIEIFPLIGGVVYVKTASELSQLGYLAPFVIKRVRVELLESEKKRYEELRSRFRLLAGGRRFNEILEAARRGEQRAIEALRIHAEMRDIVQHSEAKMREAERIVREELAKNSKIIVFTQLKEQAEEIARRTGALLLHGDLSAKEREEGLLTFRKLSSGVLVTTTVGDEGLDIPDANVGIFLSGTGSRRQFIQRLGRLLRPAPGKKAILYEIVAAKTGEEYQSRRRREFV